MRLAELVEKAMETSQSESIRALARRLDLSHGAVAMWHREERYPDFENAAELAKLAGLDPVSTAAEIRLQSPEGAKHRAILKRLAKVAASLFLALLGALPARESQALNGQFAMRQNADTLYIMRIRGDRNRRRSLTIAPRYLALLATLRAQLTRILSHAWTPAMRSGRSAAKPLCSIAATA